MKYKQTVGIVTVALLFWFHDAYAESTAVDTAAPKISATKNRKLHVTMDRIAFGQLTVLSG
jgi:hypothetical protein